MEIKKTIIPAAEMNDEELDQVAGGAISVVATVPIGTKTEKIYRCSDCNREINFDGPVVPVGNCTTISCDCGGKLIYLGTREYLVY